MPETTASPPPRKRAALSVGDLWGLLAGALILALCWRLSDVLLLAFAGGLLALGLLQLSEPLHRRWHVPQRLALGLVVLGLVLLVTGGSWLAGASAAEQLQTLRETLPRALDAGRQWLGSHAPGRWLLGLWNSASFKPEDWSQFAGLATGTLNATFGAMGSTVLVVVLGVYLAADPETYRRGCIRLVAPAWRARADKTFDTVAHNLSRWLMGQGVSMLAVALLTAAGLALIGMPLTFTLSVIAGVLEFVPYFGPIVSGVLIVAVALTEGENMALWAAGVCLIVQQAEAYLVQPLAQRWAVRLPPVLGMLAVLIFGLLFGIAGVLLAVPLIVLTMTLVEQLYVHGLLEGGGADGDGS